MLEWIAAAGAAAGAALVRAAATDAWATARDGVLRLFRRGGDRRAEAIAARLDEDVALIEAAAPEDRDDLRSRLLPSWQTRLIDLLDEFPEARDEIETWVEQVQSQLPASATSWVQHNTARDHGTVFAVQGGNQVVHQGRAREDPEGDRPRPVP